MRWSRAAKRRLDDKNIINQAKRSAVEYTAEEKASREGVDVVTVDHVSQAAEEVDGWARRS